MLYEFVCGQCGAESTEQHSMLDAPDIGSESCDPCSKCLVGRPIRVLSIPTVNREYQTARSKYPYVCRRYRGLDGVNSHNELGHPIIESIPHEREVAARNGLSRE